MFERELSSFVRFQAIELTCIYGWNPRFLSVLFGGLTAERVGARHDDSLQKWSS